MLAALLLTYFVFCISCKLVLWSRLWILEAQLNASFLFRLPSFRYSSPSLIIIHHATVKRLVHTHLFIFLSVYLWGWSPRNGISGPKEKYVIFLDIGKILLNLSVPVFPITPTNYTNFLDFCQPDMKNNIFVPLLIMRKAEHLCVVKWPVQICKKF